MCVRYRIRGLSFSRQENAVFDVTRNRVPRGGREDIPGERVNAGFSPGGGSLNFIGGKLPMKFLIRDLMDWTLAVALGCAFAHYIQTIHPLQIRYFTYFW